MACVQVAGTTVYADPIEQLDNGDWLMRSRGHSPRFSIGDIIRIKPAEIIEIASAEMPLSPDVQDHKPMASKLSQLVDVAQDTHHSIESEAEKAVDRLVKSKARAADGIGKIHGLADGYDRDASALDAFANKLSNFPPSDEK
jgi:hypothetical protein